MNRLECFERKIIRSESGCWLWQGALVKGYGRFRDGKKLYRAHRWAYEKWIGPIPEGLDLDHLCRVTRCVNPWHVEPVTVAVNALRRSLVQTHCKYGHSLDDAYLIKGVRGWQRACRTCRKIAYQKKKELFGNFWMAETVNRCKESMDHGKI